MNGWISLGRFLRTDPRDAGCAEAVAMLHVYVALVAAGAPAQERYPGIAAHLRACGPCGEALYKMMLVARRKIRARLVPHGYLDAEGGMS
jgi:hypothetical protein